MRYYIFKRSRKGFVACFARKEDLMNAILLNASKVKEVIYSKTIPVSNKLELKEVINENWGRHTKLPFAFGDVMFILAD